MKLARRQFIEYLGVICFIGFNSYGSKASNDKLNIGISNNKDVFSKKISESDMKKHQVFMQEAIKVSKGNEYYPFGAIIADFDKDIILARGVNNSGSNPILHGEIVAINNYVALHGNKNWDKVTLYTTGEPCSMCMSAIAWAGIKKVVWASNINAIRKADITQIDISAKDVALKSSEIYKPDLLLGGVLSEVTDDIFLNRKKH